MPLIRIEEAPGVEAIKPGTYPVTLIDIRPDTIITNDRGAQDIFRWKFAVDDGSEEGVEFEAISSQLTSPKTKLYAWLTALLGEDKVGVGMDFEKKDLVGREALGQFQTDAKGWTQLTALVEKPRQRRPVASDQRGPQAVADDEGAPF